MLEVENILFTAVMLFYFAAMILYFVFIAAKKESLSRVAVVLQAAGLALHTVALICRGVGAGRLPLTNQYEFATSFPCQYDFHCQVPLSGLRGFRRARDVSGYRLRRHAVKGSPGADARFAQ